MRVQQDVIYLPSPLSGADIPTTYLVCIACYNVTSSFSVPLSLPALLCYRLHTGEMVTTNDYQGRATIISNIG